MRILLALSLLAVGCATTIHDSAPHMQIKHFEEDICVIYFPSQQKTTEEVTLMLTKGGCADVIEDDLARD